MTVEGVSMTVNKNGEYIVHEENATKAYIFSNPMLATQRLVAIVEGRTRKRVSNYFKSQGKNSCTGCNVNMTCDECQRLGYDSAEESNCTLECTCEKVVNYGDIQP